MDRKISISLYITFSLISSTFCSMFANRYMDENLPSGFGCINVSSDHTSLSGTITVAGHLDYYDNKGDKQPLVWTRVWICDREPDGNDYIHKEIFTDIEGNFTSGPIDNDDGPDEDGLDIWIYVVAWNWATQVINENGTRYYARTHMCDDCPDDTYYMTGEIPEGHGAWMIFSYHSGIAAGWNYLNTTVDYEMPMATACWPCGDWPCYNPNNGVINLTDWSASYPDIILHEYGHYVMHTLYGYMPPAMEEHYINENSDASTAWVEGWANFFPLVVQNDPDLLGWNLETHHWCSAGWDDGDEVEGRVAGALWDIFDSDDDGYDSFSDGLARARATSGSTLQRRT